MIVNIGPSKAYGSVAAPPSKSMAHRYLIAAALSNGNCRINNVSQSEDILATIDCLKTIGVDADFLGSSLNITATDRLEETEELNFYCRESGSTMRFFMAIAMLIGKRSYFYGSEKLLTRPFSVYEDICKEHGISFEKLSGKILIRGQIKSGDFVVPGDISSQFITGLLFVLPLLEGDSTITITKTIESRSYILLTIQALKEFGVEVSWKDDHQLFIPGGQSYRPTDITVEGDYSNAAFLDVLNVTGGKVDVTGLVEDSLQGDRVYKEYFELLKNENAVIDISDCPDLGPVLFVVAALNHGGTFTGTSRLSIKESDRGKVMCEELDKFGISTIYEPDKITIVSSYIHKPMEPIQSHNDHRIVMAMTTLLSVTGGTLCDAEAVNKSFPDYFAKISKIGIIATKNR